MFAALAERIIDALLAADPALANSAGDHRYDDRLPDLSADAVCAARESMLRDAAGALSGVDTDELDARPSGSTTRILLALVERALFELTEVREHEWNPLRAQPGRAAARAGRPAVRPGRERLEPAWPAGLRPSRTRWRPPGRCCATARASTWRRRSGSSPAPPR